MEILLTAIIFYFIGKYSYTTKEAELLKKVKGRITQKIKGRITAVNQRTPEERRKQNTDEEAVEKEMRKLFKRIL